MTNRIQRGILTEGGAVRTRKPRLSIDDTGLQTLTEEYECDGSNLLNFIPQINDPHPEYPGLVAKEIFPEFLDGGKGRWRAVYHGLIFTTDNLLPADVYSAETVAQQEDIATFPGFEDIAGTPQNPLNGAIFDDDLGTFVAFGPTAPPALRGVSAYFAPSVAIFRVRFTNSPPTGGANVGKIDSPGGPLQGPNQSGQQNWLKMTFRTEQFGDIWQTRESWLRSGDLGWNQDIYG